mmetsp:Transcript_36321/g.76293  ORF Transcript_36321/g.76293 Transcript_36321/m.76293 type:complete len:80 (+) Transcript_36321:813-1052(+)
MPTYTHKLSQCTKKEELTQVSCPAFKGERISMNLVKNIHLFYILIFYSYQTTPITVQLFPDDAELVSQMEVVGRHKAET